MPRYIQFPLEESSIDPLSNVNDPLLQSGNGKLLHDATMKQTHEEDISHTGDLSRRTFILAGGPAVLFALMIIVATFFYNDAPYTVMVSFLLTLAKAVCVTRLFNGRRWIRWLGPFLAIASFAGLVAGLSVYFSQLAPYYRYRESIKHVNVAPTEPGKRFFGTGMVTFVSGTVVDVDRSVGYLSARAGARMCIAPVIDGSMSPADPVTFFAVGTDCCSWRGLFTCGDVDNAAAHSALLSLSAPTEGGVVPWLAWFKGSNVIGEGYQAALQLQQAVYGTVVAESPRFLRWTKDPLAIQDGYFSGAVWSVVAWIAEFTCGSLIVGFCASLGSDVLWAKAHHACGDFREAAMGWQFDHSPNKQRGKAARSRYHLQYL
mmetsp:Transcript_19841/g.38103  ORF Transcript_19841/g.38103 Transcript_19841/m.38103 type:complete len:374 (-) Transcript_19841:51-1172(-)